MQQIEAAAAQARTAGFDHCECRGYRHGRIECIAARRQNFLPRLARQWIGTGDGRLVRNCEVRRGRALRRQRRCRALNGRGVISECRRRRRDDRGNECRDRQ
jgi:hypothetical protein